MRQIVCKISNGTSKGTGFLVDSKHVITAQHVLKKVDEEIKLEFTNLPGYEESTECTAVIVDADKIKDIAILKLDVDIVIEDFSYWPICIDEVSENIKWNTFGYPTTRRTIGIDLDGNVIRTNIKEPGIKQDLDLSCRLNITEYGGLSGAPLMIENSIYGIILTKLDGTLGARSFKECQEFLEKNGFEFIEEDIISDYHISNEILRAFEERLLSCNGGYFLLKGSPGSGKTTFVKNFNLYQNVNLKGFNIIGKYFVKDPNDNIPVVYRASYEIVGSWLEDVLNNALNRTSNQKREHKKNEWISIISGLFSELSSYYSSKKTKGILFMDGVDEADTSQLRDILDLLPQKNLENIQIVISCKNEVLIPSEFRRVIDDRNIFRLSPLEHNKVRTYVYEHIKERFNSLTLANKIAEKSEGHPLYLKYLMDEAVKKNTEEEVFILLGELSEINGDIKKYYEIIWSKLQRKPEELYILATISRLREPMKIEDFKEILESKYKLLLINFLDDISHLLTSKEIMFIYHSSFNEFVKDKTQYIEYDIQKEIATFCKTNTDNIYSIRNIIYHVLLQQEEGRQEVLDLCNQNWTDRCSINHVDPDRVLKDLESVLCYAFENKVDVSDSLRLLLLEQRINYRYNDIFTSCFLDFSNLLLEEGKYSDVMKYLVRNDTLLVEGELLVTHILSFLENGALEEAKRLFDLLENEILRKGEINELLVGEKYIFLKVLAIIAAYDPEEYFVYFIQELQTISEYKELYEEVGTLSAAIRLLKDEKYIGIAELRGMFDSLNANLAPILVKVLYNLEKYKRFFKENRTSLSVNLINDLILELRTYNFDKYSEEMFLNPIIDYKVDVDDVSKMISNIDVSKSLNIREENGVDFNTKEFRNFYILTIFKGFICDDILYIEIDKNKDWEKYIESLVTYMGGLKGKYWRMRSEDQSEEILLNCFDNDIKDKLFNFIEFTLQERSKWQRSYFLVEDVFVYIYLELANIIKEYFPSKVNEFLQVINERMDRQLGLFTEGYRECIIEILKIFKYQTDARVQIFNIIKKLETHVLLGVQNRIERVDAILKIAIAYRRNNNIPNSEQAFRFMLNASMGPSWYKEDQFSLVGSALKYLKHSNEIFNYLPKMSLILEYASGEMTFKRYVRYEQEEFLGHLCKLGLVKDAINQLKNHFLPSPSILIKRVEADQIDYISEGNGYYLGANTLEIQNCILNILDCTENLDDSVKWVLAEIAIVGEQRYLNSVVEVFESILMSNKFNDNFNKYIKRLKKIYISVLDSESKIEVINLLKRYTSEDLLETIDNEFKASNLDVFDLKDYTDPTSVTIKPEEQVDSDISLYYPGTFGTNTSINDANAIIKEGLQEIEMQNVELGVKKITEGLKTFQNGGWNLWINSLPLIDQCFATLKDNVSVEELIYHLKDIIFEEQNAPNWIIVNKIVSLYSNRFDSQVVEILVREIVNHLETLVDLPSNYKLDFEWTMEKEKINNNKEVIELILWMFELPTNRIRYRLVDILMFAVKVNHQIFLPYIIEESIRENPTVSSTLCANVLYKINDIKPELINMYLQNPYFLNKIKKIRHFSIKYLFDKYIYINVENCGEISVPVFEDSVDSINVSNRKFWVKEIPLLVELEAVSVWNKQQYAILEKQILKHLKLEDIEELNKFKKYLARAYDRRVDNKLLENMYLNELNKILYPYIYTDKKEIIFGILGEIKL